MSDVIGIIGAMDTEVKTLCECLTEKEIVEYAGLKFNKGKIGPNSVVVVKSGVGKVNAGICAQILILKFGATKVINTGIAGAAGADLKVFDFVVSTEAVYHDVDVRIFGYKIGQIPGLDNFFAADAAMAEKAVEVFKNSDFSKGHRVEKGRIASGDQFIADKAVKNNIVANFAPLCVEMEGAAIAHACTVNKVPFVIIRCLSDCADDTATSTYEFNEDTCAQMCAEFVKKLIAVL